MHPAKHSLAPEGQRRSKTVEDAAGPAELIARLASQELEIESLCVEVLERYEEATFVYRLTERIGSARGERAIAGLALCEAVNVLGAGSGELWLKIGEKLVLAASHPESPASLPPLSVQEVVATGRSSVRNGSLGAEATAVVALPEHAGATRGALVLKGRPEGRGYLTGELKLMTTVAALAAAFIRNERLAETARGAEARLRDGEIARAIHRGLLPHHDPLFAGLDVSGGFLAADGLGGDYYGYVAMVDGSLGIAIADVSGHGVGAALYMAIAKGALQSEARDILSAGDVLGRINEVLASDFSATDMFATLVFARFLPDGRRMVWSNAGHNAPLLLRGNGDIEMLKPCGPALGIVSGARWRDLDERFAPGDVLLFYTDGLVDARNAAGRSFGIERLIEAVRGSSGNAAAIRENVLEALSRHVAAAPFADDVTLVVARGVPLEEEP